MNEKINGASLPSVAALSYLGDARHSLYVRRMLVSRGLTKSGDLNREALRFVTAEAQARMYLRIADELTTDEADVFRMPAVLASCHNRNTLPMAALTFPPVSV